jgi:PAS domain S-box-containing protein
MGINYHFPLSMAHGHPERSEGSRPGQTSELLLCAQHDHAVSASVIGIKGPQAFKFICMGLIGPGPNRQARAARKRSSSESSTLRDDLATVLWPGHGILLGMLQYPATCFLAASAYSPEDLEAEIERRVIERTIELQTANALLSERVQASEAAHTRALASEERYRRLFEASMDAIVLTDDDGVYLDANEAAAALFGLPRERLIGVRAVDLREDNGPEAFANHRRYLASGRDAGEFAFRRPDGSLRVAQYTAVRLGANLHQSILRDITSGREAELRLRSSLAEKEILLKEIHHRVKNNLQVIASMLRLQSDQIGDPGVRELFLESQRRVRAMALVHEWLYQAPDLARINLAAYVRTLISDLQRAFRAIASNVTIRSEVQVIQVDVDQAMALGLILNELIANCLKHAFAAGRSGTIIVSGSRRPGEALVLSVSDDGTGLPDKLDPTQSPSMGLQIVTALATQIGGTLTWQRSPGTVVTLHVPGRA